MRQREEDMKWGVRNTSHRVQQPCGHMILWSTWIHAGCEHSSTLSGKRRSAVLFFGLLLLLLSQALVPITSHHGRKSCCSCCCQGTEITAVNVLPGTICAAASSMLSSLGTDRHKLIQFSNWCHRSYWWHGISTQLYISSRVGNKKHLRAGDFFFQTRKSFP